MVVTFTVSFKEYHLRLLGRCLSSAFVNDKYYDSFGQAYPLLAGLRGGPTCTTYYQLIEVRDVSYYGYIRMDRPDAWAPETQTECWSH